MAENSAVREALFLLLRRALGRLRPADEAFAGLPAAAWQALYRLAAAQGVLGIAWDGLRLLEEAGGLPADGAPPRELRIGWSFNTAQDERRYARQRRTIGRLAAFYAQHGIRTMLLKGYGLSLCYPVPEHRPCGDIDIWLYGRQQEADALLRREKGIAIDEEKHLHTVFRIDGVMVENHYDFLNVHAHPSNRQLERMLRTYAAQPGEEIDVEGATVVLPSADFNALFLLRHAAAHFAAAEIGVRHLLDWMLFAERYSDRTDWEQLERTAREMNMHRFLHCMNALATDLLGMEAACVPPVPRDPALERRVLDDILAPRFGEIPPKIGLLRGLIFRTRRWWANRWKHRIVYREGLLRTFFVQLRSHLLKPASLRH